jgi:hypothetical protein
VRYVRRDAVEIRNLLVSNAEFARFLNAMAEAGMPNSHSGTYLLACEMPHERGGRLHQDKTTGLWDVSTGFDDHPAYWVTWIGAAAFAAWTGARLPARDEILGLTASATVSNAGYQSGDVTPLASPDAILMRSIICSATCECGAATGRRHRTAWMARPHGGYLASPGTPLPRGRRHTGRGTGTSWAAPGGSASA